MRVKSHPASAGVAQLVEQLICNQPVGGSNPLTSSMLCVLSVEEAVWGGGNLKV